LIIICAMKRTHSPALTNMGLAFATGILLLQLVQARREPLQTLLVRDPSVGLNTGGHLHSAVTAVEEAGLAEAREPGVVLAARQALFNYVTKQGLETLRARVATLVIPDQTKTFNL
jgi:hypothetical protein